MKHQRLNCLRFNQNSLEVHITSLERLTLEKDLGILIDCQLNFSEHMFAAAKKANGIMGACNKKNFYSS